MNQVFFPEIKKLHPRIYAYSDSNPQYKGLLKIGYTTRTAEIRIKEQYPTLRPGKLPFKIEFDESAINQKGETFIDEDVFDILRSRNIANPEGEWFRCKISDVRSAVNYLKSEGQTFRSLKFQLRPEQKETIRKTAKYFREIKKTDPKKTPHFLWNAKMRFGKSFTAYKLAIEMSWKRILVITFKPAVQSAWEDDLLNHIDFKDWQFISNNRNNFEQIKKSKPFVCFGSFQDYLGKNKVGGIKPKNEWVHTINWDCVIFDEYHYGAWREKAKELFEAEGKEEINKSFGEGINYFDETLLPISTYHYLYLSGTPFRAIESGEFIEEQIFNWTYSDEQEAKTKWVKKNNPYASLPRMVLMTYQLPDSVKEIAAQGEFDEFDLNYFFEAHDEKNKATFVHKNEVQKWLDLIRGDFLETTIDNLKLGSKKPPFPFSDSRLLNILSHTFWFLPSVASCYAMNNLLNERQNKFYHQYKIIVAAGPSAGIGVKALEPVKSAMDDPLKTKTITLSCGKLTTGVTVKPWSGILMLRNCSSPETYFQAAFRVQNPWEIPNPDDLSPNAKEIIKKECYIFDFAPFRALRQISDYSCRLSIKEYSAEKKVEEFIKFLPILAYDGTSMKQVDAADILDIALSGTSATLLAKRWESALLVNVDNATLQRIINNETAMEVLMNIEGFRNLRNDIEVIINNSESIKKMKEKANQNDLSKKEKKQLTDEEKEYKSKRKMIQEKLIKFATRIPVFMYLTDYREKKLKDVITKLEPALFKKVTGLSVEDFELLVSLNVFNNSLMNEAIYNFKRYEDASLTYSGINKHANEDIGLFDTVINKNDLNRIFVNSP